MGQQPETGQATIDGAAGRRSLHDLVASRAAQLRTHVADDLEAGRNILKNLGDIFAELAQLTAAFRAGLFRRLVCPGLARQMIGERVALGAAADEIQPALQGLAAGGPMDKVATNTAATVEQLKKVNDNLPNYGDNMAFA